MGLDSHSGRAVAIVTGGSSGAGREVAHALASWTWPTVIVYLHHQSEAEATVAEVIAAGGTIVAVRADLADELDVQRLFIESIAAFGDIDIVIHTTTDNAGFLYERAARYVRQGGAIIITAAAERIRPWVASNLRERGISITRTSPESVLAFLEGWRQQISG